MPCCLAQPITVDNIEEIDTEMGKKGSWFRSVKKAIGSESKEQTDQKPSKSKKKWFGKKKVTDPILSEAEAVEETATTTSTAATTTTTTIITPQPVAAPPAPLPQESAKAKEMEEMQRQHTSSIAIATAKAAEAAMAAAMAAAELTRLTNATRFPGKSKEEMSAIRIQTAFRGYLARRALRVLRGLERMKTLMDGQSVKRQTANALKCMQALVRVQSEIHARRLRTSEENLARQRQLLDKHDKELDKIQSIQKNGDGWNTSAKSKEQIQARLQSKHEASVKRERALAYSFNHQRTWRNSPTTKPAQTLFMESINPHWGWSWLERWLDARPWENASPGNPDLAPLRSSLHTTPSGSQIAKALLYHVTDKSQSATSSPRSLHSTTSLRTPTTKQRNSTGRLSTSSAPRARIKPSASARASPRRRVNRDDQEEDAKSTVSMQSEIISRRRSVVAREVDNESLASSPADVGVTLPRYMASTESARARSRMGSPSSTGDGMDRVSVCSAKRGVSYPSSPARSRKSTSSVTET